MRRCIALVLVLVMSITLLPVADAAAKSTKATVNMKAKKVDMYVYSATTKVKTDLYFNGKSDIPYVDLEEQREGM